jgi:hypothetical protein
LIEYRLVSQPSVDLDVESAFDWYENEQSGLGVEFLDELRAIYDRIADGPPKYQELRSGIRRAILGRFPYAAWKAALLSSSPFSAMSHKYRSKGGALRGLGNRYRLHAEA